MRSKLSSFLFFNSHIKYLPNLVLLTFWKLPSTILPFFLAHSGPPYLLSGPFKVLLSFGLPPSLICRALLYGITLPLDSTHVIAAPPCSSSQVPVHYLSNKCQPWTSLSSSIPYHNILAIHSPSALSHFAFLLQSFMLFVLCSFSYYFPSAWNFHLSKVQLSKAHLPFETQILLFTTALSKFLRSE